MEFAYLAIGTFFGFVIAWLYFKLSRNQTTEAPIDQNPMYVQALRTIENAQSQIRTLQVEKEGKIADLASAQTQVIALNDKINGQEQLLKTLKVFDTFRVFRIDTKPINYLPPAGQFSFKNLVNSVLRCREVPSPS